MAKDGSVLVRLEAKAAGRRDEQGVRPGVIATDTADRRVDGVVVVPDRPIEGVVVVVVAAPVVVIVAAVLGVAFLAYGLHGMGVAGGGGGGMAEPVATMAVVVFGVVVVAAAAAVSDVITWSTYRVR